MTDSIKVQKLKSRLKERFGDRYLEFMHDLSNYQLSHKDLRIKWNVSESTITRWINILSYSRTGNIKMLLRNQVKVNQRVKKRQETAAKILKLIQQSR